MRSDLLYKRYHKHKIQNLMFSIIKNLKKVNRQCHQIKHNAGNKTLLNLLHTYCPNGKFSSLATMPESMKYIGM